MHTFIMIQCKTICRNTYAQKVYASIFLNQIFSLFPLVKMNANYAEICRLGNLEANFQQFRLFIFSEIFTMLLWNINN